MKVFALVGIVALAFAQHLEKVPRHPTRDIVELAQGNPDLSILVTALKAADLVGTLKTPCPNGPNHCTFGNGFTVFAPTNEAFNALPAGILDNLLKPENKDDLRELLLEHVLGGETNQEFLQFQSFYKTAAHTELCPESDGARPVRTRPVRVAPCRFSRKTHPFVTFKGELRTLTVPDLSATNGIVHIIDGVLTGFPKTTPAPETTPAPQPAGQNLVQLCESTPNLTILTAALVAADLTDTLSSMSANFTVFAPTDNAFNALPAGVLDDLMKPENKKQLADILTYHVLPEQVLSTDLQPFQAVTTVEGKPLHVTVFGGHVRVGPSLLSKDLKNVIAADNLATNGVAHIIDGVLIPPETVMV